MPPDAIAELRILDQLDSHILRPASPIGAHAGLPKRIHADPLSWLCHDWPNPTHLPAVHCAPADPNVHAIPHQHAIADGHFNAAGNADEHRNTHVHPLYKHTTRHADATRRHATSTPTNTPTVTNTPLPTCMPTITSTPTQTWTPTITSTPKESQTDADVDTNNHQPPTQTFTPTGTSTRWPDATLVPGLNYPNDVAINAATHRVHVSGRDNYRLTTIDGVSLVVLERCDCRPAAVGCGRQRHAKQGICGQLLQRQHPRTGRLDARPAACHPGRGPDLPSCASMRTLTGYSSSPTATIASSCSTVRPIRFWMSSRQVASAPGGSAVNPPPEPAVRQQP